MPGNSDYGKMSDERLTALVRQGDMSACEFLLEKYKNLVRSATAPYYLEGADRDDLLQEGMIGLYNAIHSFDGEKGYSFTAFAVSCIKRNAISAVRRSQRKKNGPLNSYVSLEQSPAGDDAGGLPRLPDPELLFIEAESDVLLRERLKSSLTKLEYSVLLLFMEGRSYREIADLLGKDEKAVDNALRRIKNKMKEDKDDGKER